MRVAESFSGHDMTHFWTTNKHTNLFGFIGLPLILILAGLVTGGGVAILPLSLAFILVAISALALLWVTPEIWQGPIRLNRLFLLGTVIAGMVIPSYVAAVFPGVPYISARRFFWFGLAATFLLSISGSKRARSLIIDTLRASPTLSCLICAYLLVRVVATLLSTKIGSSITQDINFTLSFYIPFFSFILVLRTEKDIKLLINIILFATMINLMLAMPEMVTKKPVLMMLMPKYVQQQMLADNPLLADMIYGTSVTRNGLYRADSIFNTSLSFGEFAAMAAPFGLFNLLSGNSTATRIWGGLSFGGAVLSVVLAGARGGYVCLLASSCICLSLWAYRWTRRNPQSIAGALLIVLAVLGSCTVVGSVAFIGSVHKIVLGGGASVSSTDSRRQQWDLAKPKILAKPVVGYGPGTSADVVGWTPYPGAPLSLDSYLIGTLVDTGILGFITFYGAILVAAVGAVRLYLRSTSSASDVANPLAGAIIAFGVYRITLNQVENSALFYQILAATIVITYISAQRNILMNGIQSKSDFEHSADFVRKATI